MCGIAGILSFSDRPVPVDAVRRMSRAQRHRGPDGENVVAFTERGALRATDASRPVIESSRPWAVLAHNRLAILDLSDHAAQPMFTRDGRYALTYNGEIYNYLELKQHLPADVPLRSTSDTEILLNLLEHRGMDALPMLNGMWGFALLDSQHRELWLSRDRFGVKPLYYARADGFLLFASEIKALFASGMLSAKFDVQPVVNYLLYDDWSVQDGKTFYQDVMQIQPGGWMKVTRQGHETRGTFFNLRAEAIEPKSMPMAQLIDEHRRLFRDAVSLRLRSDVKVGSCLSGGVDSCNVVIAAADLLRQQGQKMHTFTIAMRDGGIDETAPARRIAQLNDCHWTSHPIEDQLQFDTVLDFILTNEEPLPLFGSIVQYELYRFIASQGVKVVLDGQGGDETYCGYTWFYHNLLGQLSAWEKSWWRWRIRRRCNATPAMLKRYGRLETDVRARVNPAVYEALNDVNYDQPQSTTWHRIAAARSWSDRQAAACENHELRYLLRDGDRNAMRWGVESRFPFLDYRILTATNRMDPRQLMRGGWTKYISRSFPTARQAPRSILWNQTKRGFYNNPQGPFADVALPYIRASRDALARQIGDGLNVDKLITLVEEGRLRWWRLLNLAALAVQMPAMADESRATGRRAA
ncbi:MAG: asparagine synthase (glutamine-hydrolyzing) [Phycisphaeraceae bacterium]|nr:asparagine synthase (glutamine-hydrolyzing) [Phycisphaeraceae bacterium]